MEDKVCDGCRYLGSEDALKGYVPDRCMKTGRVLQVRPGMAGSSFLRRPAWCQQENNNKGVGK